MLRVWMALLGRVNLLGRVKWNKKRRDDTPITPIDAANRRLTFDAAQCCELRRLPLLSDDFHPRTADFESSPSTLFGPFLHDFEACGFAIDRPI
ncbi:hypothetical protein B7486_10750 [cyanobacterium TDX16]|nr:hypothetical protein B7486_10750 [cyanobacterium TDX16]